uniref:Uncharacterized protein n=1 Tax=Anguilla anguilla TaxID=7936 RepID=A0A0E9XFJ7_ANGAN
MFYYLGDTLPSPQIWKKTRFTTFAVLLFNKQSHHTDKLFILN